VSVGAEPAGSSASPAAKVYGLRFMTVEQDDSLGGSIYPPTQSATGVNPWVNARWVTL